MNSLLKLNKTFTMMVVDDSNVICRKIERGADGAYFSVIATANSGLEAVLAYRKLKPEVVTMDITMPHMDGIDCIEQIMAINPNVRILVISALADKSTGIEALERGARGFLCKPFTDDQLNAALAELVED
jgi:two-component system chemotaxis response regulator CheY